MFTLQVDLFITHLKHKLYVSPCSRSGILGNRCSQHELLGSRIICLPSNCSHAQGDSKDTTVQLCNNTDSPRMARNALVLGSSSTLNRNSTTINSVSNTIQAVLRNQVKSKVVHSNPQYISLYAWCRRVSNSKNKVSLLKWQREFVPLKRHQQEPSISQSRPFLKPTIKQVSDFFMHLQYIRTCTGILPQSDGYGIAVNKTLGWLGYHIVPLTLNIL